jgi:hypothetical protein
VISAGPEVAAGMSIGGAVEARELDRLGTGVPDDADDADDADVAAVAAVVEVLEVMSDGEDVHAARSTRPATCVESAAVFVVGERPMP